MFRSINDEIRPVPALAGAGVASIALVGIQAFLVVMVDYRPPAPAFIELVKPIQLSPRPEHRTENPRGAQKQAHVPAQTTTPKPARAAPGALLAQPGTPSWDAHVERGKRLTLQIFAKNSLPVLRAHRVQLALDNHRPRGEASIFDLSTNVYARTSVPGGIVVRELDDMPPLPGLEQALRAKERELGGEVTIYALYSESLYAVLQSLTYQALENAGISPDTVRRADVELLSAGGRSFTVRLAAHS